MAMLLLLYAALYVTAQSIVCTIVNRCRALLLYYTSHSSPNLFDAAAALILSSCSCYHSRSARPFFFLASFSCGTNWAR